MYQSQNSFQKNVYSSRVISPNSKSSYNGIQTRDQLGQTAEDPLVSGRSVGLGGARRVAVQVHVHEASGVADLVREVAAALELRPR